MPLAWKRSSSSEPKSSPTTPTTRTSVNMLAEIEKCVAAPPRMRSRRPNGVSSESNATEPTTVTVIAEPAAVAESRPAAARSASARSVRSQREVERRVRPKWP